MTVSEFDTFRSNTTRGYANEQVRAGNWPAKGAEARAEAANSTLLPQGLDTPGTLLLMAENSEGTTIGHIWIVLEREADSGSGGWIYYIQIDPIHQGKGYGRALLRAAEEESARRGVTRLGLNVFGSNEIARSLYESSGYQVASTLMRKDLPPLN